jgi:extradiol dioxygenase family protein
MSSTRSESAIESSRARTVDMKLEVVVIPVSDVDRAKRFYGAWVGGSTPTWPVVTSFGSYSLRHRARRARSTLARDGVGTSYSRIGDFA